MISLILLWVFLVTVWITSGYCIIDRCDKRQVPDSCLIQLLALCPIVNTLIAMYLGMRYGNWKESLKVLFSND